MEVNNHWLSGWQHFGSEVIFTLNLENFSVQWARPQLSYDHSSRHQQFRHLDILFGAHQHMHAQQNFHLKRSLVCLVVCPPFISHIDHLYSSSDWIMNIRNAKVSVKSTVARPWTIFFPVSLKTCSICSTVTCFACLKTIRWNTISTMHWAGLSSPMWLRMNVDALWDMFSLKCMC